MLFGRPVPMPAVCPCSDFTPLLGTILPLRGGFSKGVCTKSLVIRIWYWSRLRLRLGLWLRLRLRLRCGQIC